MRFALTPLAVAATLCCSLGPARAQLIIEDKLTGASSHYDWIALDGACLTAGDDTGSIPACASLSYWAGKTLIGGVDGRLPDPVGAGALRLSNGGPAPGGGVGAVVSRFTFPMRQGLKVTFTTTTYGGNNLRRTGADGMSFFLADGARPPTRGGSGGALGYACRNYSDGEDGVDGGYIGLGIDEFGNFSNPRDNTDSGPGPGPNRVSLRGAGNVRWSTLNREHPLYYPATLAPERRSEAVKNTCRTGALWNYSGASLTDATGAAVADGAQTGERLPYNYPFLVSGDMPERVRISNQQNVAAPLRGQAVPITYALSISQDGLLNFGYSVNGGVLQPLVNNRPITDFNGPVPDSMRFGFAASTGSGTNVHEISCFKAAPLDEASTSAAVNAQPSARLQAGAQVYLAYNHPKNWWGQLEAHSLLEDVASDTVLIGSWANWDAHCTLTGGACASMGQAAPAVAATAPDARRLLTWNGGGVPLRWASLSAAQQAALTAGDPAATAERLQYLRGDRSREVAAGGPLRSRSGLLGDMQNASPTHVGAPASPYDGPWADALAAGAAAPENAGQAYAAFRDGLGGRAPMVYVGANDGLLHGFSAADGREALGYMPAAVLDSIHSSTPALDFSGTRYAHNLYVDATPGTGDLYYAGRWHSWLVGGLGAPRNEDGALADPTVAAGGTLYALDITDPSRFSEANAAALAVGEWNASTLACTGDSGCGRHLGSVSGTPLIRRLHNGQWAVLFGNGENSASGSAGLFMMLVDPASGATSFRFLDTGAVGGAAGKNGIVSLTAADLDGDHITDFVYAGDLQGNLWRFDLSAGDPAAWRASAAPVVRTGQPITTRPMVAAVPGSGRPSRPRVIVSFGTGQARPQTLASQAQYATGTQALYGVWDADMEAWNARAGVMAQYASLPAPGTATAAQLQAQSLTEGSSATGQALRTVSRFKVCWRGSDTCESANDQLGWQLPLAAGEQVLYHPVLAYGMFIVNTTLPARADRLRCEDTPASGYTMAVAVDSGSADTRAFFTDTAVPYVAGLALNATGSPQVVTTRTKAHLVQQTVGGQGIVTRVNPVLTGPGRRINWIQLR